jgi:hypothetical protein
MEQAATVTGVWNEHQAASQSKHKEMYRHDDSEWCDGWQLNQWDVQMISWYPSVNLDELSQFG